MRPTDLKFRHPNEKTPDPYDSFVTSTGSSLLQHKKRTKSTFSTAKRFPSLSSDKTSFWRGPGSYDLNGFSIGQRKIKGVPVIRPYHGNKDVGNNSYFFSGNCLVFEPCISLMNKKKARECFTSNGMINRSRPTTASSKNHTTLKKISFSPCEDSPVRPQSAFDYGI
jgi:hypothetical protein